MTGDGVAVVGFKFQVSNTHGDGFINHAECYSLKIMIMKTLIS